MRIMKTVFKLAALVAAGILLFVVLLLLFIQTEFFKEQARLIAAEQVRKNTGAMLRLGRIEGNFITGITLIDVGLIVEGVPFASAERIRVSYLLPALLYNTVMVYHVHISGLRGYVFRDVHGVWNFNKLGQPGASVGTKKKKPAGKPPAIFARNVIIEGGLVVLEDAAGVVSRRSVEGLNIAASFSMYPRAGKNVIALALKRLRFISSNPALTLVNLRGSASLSGNNATFDNLTIEMPATRGRVHGTIRNISSPVYNVLADFPRVGLSDIRQLLPGVSLEGELSTYLSLRGPLNALQVNHRLRYRQLQIVSEALLDGNSGTMVLNSSVRDFRPQDILPFCGGGIEKNNCVNGDISFDLAAEAGVRNGTLESAAAHLSFLPSRVETVAISSAAINAVLNGSRLSISSSSIESSAGTVSIAGEGEVPGLIAPGGMIDARIELGLKNIDLAAVLNHPSLKSDINGMIRIAAAGMPRAKQGAVNISGTVAVSSTTFAGLAVSAVDIRASYAGTAVMLEDCRIRSEAADADISGSFNVNSGFDISYHVTANDLGILSRIMPDFQTEGKIDVSGKLRGTMVEPWLTASVRGEDAGYGAVSVRMAAVDIDVRKMGRYPSGTIRADARDLNVNGLALRHVIVQGEAGQQIVSARTEIERDNERRYALSGTVTGLAESTSALRIDEFQVAAGTVAWTAVRPIEGTFSKKGMQVDVFELAKEDQYISLHGKIPSSGFIDFTVSVSSVDIADLARIGGISIPAGGRLNSSMRLTGNALSPMLTGYIALQEGIFGGFAFDLLRADLGYADRRARIDMILDRSSRRLLSAAGTIPVDLAFTGVTKRFPPGGLSVSVSSGNLDPALLKAFVKDVEKAGGNMTLEAILSGDPLRPSIRGTLRIDNAFVRIGTLGTDYTGINGSVVIDSGTVTVERLSVTSGGGDANLHGNLLLTGYVPSSTDLVLTCRKFQPMDSNVFSGTIDADLRLAGPSDRCVLGGAVTILESVVNIPGTTRKQVEEIEIVETGTARGTAKVVVNRRNQIPLLRNLVMNVDLSVPGNTWVKGRGVNAELKGKVTFRQDPGKQPFIIGDIETVRGTYDLRGRSLKIDRGIITFTGTRQLDANLDIMATGKVSDVTIIVIIGGTLEKPEISLRSQPSMDESDILAYLIFGKPTSRLTEKENRAVQSTAVQVIGNIAAKGIREVLGRQLAPDVFDIVSSATESGFEVGKYLTQRLFVRYEWRLGVEEVNQTIIDYQLNSRFNLHSQVGYAPTEGVDLFWTVHY